MAIPMAGPILTSEERNPASDPQQDCNEINLCREKGGRTERSAVISDPRCSSVVLLPLRNFVAEESIWLILSSCPCIPSCEWIQYFANGAHSKFECLHFLTQWRFCQLCAVFNLSSSATKSWGIHGNEHLQNRVQKMSSENLINA